MTQARQAPRPELADGLQMGALAVHPGAGPLPEAGRQFRHAPPATEVSQIRPPEQPPAALQVMHCPLPPLAAVSHAGNCELQPGATPPSREGAQLRHWPAPPLAAVSQTWVPVQPRVELQFRQVSVAVSQNWLVAQAGEHCGPASGVSSTQCPAWHT
jgi:hypothetical protein